MSLARPLLGEFLGTFLLVGIGTGSVALAVLGGRLDGPWQVPAAWGLGVTAAIYASAPLSGAHLNPAVSLALGLWRPGSFPRGRVLPYFGAQMAGAFAAGLVVLAASGPALSRFEAERGLVRGAPGSERAAMVFGEYFPNPAIHGTGPDAEARVSPATAFLVEAAATAALVLAVFALADPAARVPCPPRLVPPLVGAVVAGLIVLVAPTTQCCLNPARDWGPRLVSWLAGFGSVAIPGPRGGAWVYLAGPLAGGAAGGLVYERVLAPLRRAP